MFYKILWEEGMFLQPHHFQQQDAYLESLIKKYYIHHNKHFWGIKDIFIDEDALMRNKLIITHCSGILPDGTMFDTYTNTKAVKTKDLPESFDELYVYIGIKPNNRANKNREKNCQYGTTDTTLINYTNTHGDAAENKIDARVCKLNIQILFDTQKDLEEYCYIPIAKIYQKQSIAFIEKDSHIIPYTCVQKSLLLKSYLEQFEKGLTKYIGNNITKLENKITSNDSAFLFILHIINHYKNLVVYFYQPLNIGPYQLFTLFMHFISEINLFTVNIDLEKVQLTYRHDNLYETFHPIQKILNSIFSSLLQEKVIKITFEDKGEIFTSSFVDRNIKSCEYIIQIVYDSSVYTADVQLITNSMKIASTDQINKIIVNQVSGVKANVSLDKSPITEVPSEGNSIYIFIKQEGSLWDSILNMKNIALYLPKNVLVIKNAYLWMAYK